jgi:murein DD-endopeptidase MepM/ murein hydrolase activator NlpD
MVLAHSSPRPPSAPLFFGLSPAVAGGPSSPRFPDLGGLAGGLPGLGARGGRRGGDAAGLVSGPGHSPGALPARPIGVRPGPAPSAPAAPPRAPRPEGPRTGGHPVERQDRQEPRPDPRDPRRAPQRRDVRGDRRPAPPTGRQTGPSPLRGRLAVAAVAAGALATAGHSLAGLDALGDTSSTTAELALASERGTDRGAGTSSVTDSASTGLDAATSGVLPVIAPAAAGTASSTSSSSSEASSDEGPGQLSAIAKAAERSAAQARAAAEAARPDFVKPADGRFTSGFGARWGSSHRGIDIAGPIGTPIVSVGDGTVIESGPASGFGMWVKVQLEDGTINVYGHVNRSYVEEGQRVRAGEEIAEIGNRGRSTGPHLHFEVWTEGGSKINPLPWLAERGISLGGQQD